jgi:two-component system LytT family sensor kinase
MEGSNWLGRCQEFAVNGRSVAASGFDRERRWTHVQERQYVRNMPSYRELGEVRPAYVRTLRIPLRWIWAAWALPALLSGFNTFMQSRLSRETPDWHWLLFNSLDWLIYAFLTPFVFRFSRRFPLVREHLRLRIWMHMLAALALCVAWAGMGTIIRWVIFPAPSGASAFGYLQGFVSWIFTTLPFGVGVYFALVGIEHSLFYFQQVRVREMQAAQLTAQLSEARLSALQMQINPHFLFNSLNAITVLVRDKDTAGASRMLELLSDVLRQVLQTDTTHVTTLTKELEFLSRYLAIEQIRFSDRLRPHIQVDPEVSKALVPVFVLQPLVENAIRHGIAAQADAGLVEITAKRVAGQLILTVRDDGALPSTPSREQTPSGEGIGLSNTRARLQTLYGDAAALETGFGEQGGFIATVRLPYREDSGGNEQDPYSGS